MVYVPEGKFEMGSEDGESDESPVHTVYLDTYWMYKYEVTNEQYQIYQFFAEDPEGRTLEFQAFLHPVEPIGF